MSNERPPDPGSGVLKKTGARPAGATGLPPGRSEARRHPRFLIFGATVRLQRKGARALFGLLDKGVPGGGVDLSEGGIRVSTGVELPVNTPLEVHLEIAKLKDQLSSGGVVRWCRSDPANPSGYHVGIMFVDVDPAQEKKIGRMRLWFTSDQCIEYRERKDASERKLPKVTATEEVRHVPEAAAEAGPGLWVVSLTGSLEGSELEAFQSVVDALLGKDVRGLMVDLRNARPGPNRSVSSFIKIIDQAAFRGVRSVFIAAPSSLRTLIEANTNGNREFAPDVTLGRELLESTRPPGPEPDGGGPRNP
jgi:hypothetical protein